MRFIYDWGCKQSSGPFISLLRIPEEFIHPRLRTADLNQTQSFFRKATMEQFFLTESFFFQKTNRNVYFGRAKPKKFYHTSNKFQTHAQNIAFLWNTHLLFFEIFFCKFLYLKAVFNFCHYNSDST